MTSYQRFTAVLLSISAEHATDIQKSSREGDYFSSSLTFSLSPLCLNEGKANSTETDRAGCSSAAAQTLPVWTHVQASCSNSAKQPSSAALAPCVEQGSEFHLVVFTELNLIACGNLLAKFVTSAGETDSMLASVEVNKIQLNVN